MLKETSLRQINSDYIKEPKIEIGLGNKSSPIARILKFKWSV